MNPTQTQTTLAPIIAFIAGLLAGKGVFGFDTATWTYIIGGLAGIGTVVWGAIAARKSAIVSTAAAMPEVKQVVLDPTVPGASALNAATPSNVVVKGV